MQVVKIKQILIEKRERKRRIWKHQNHLAECVYHHICPRCGGILSSVYTRIKWKWVIPTFWIVVECPKCKWNIYGKNVHDEIRGSAMDFPKLHTPIG